MAIWQRPVVLALLLVVARDCAGDASWDDPWVTCSPDKYIQKFDPVNKVVYLYEDVPQDWKIAELHVKAAAGDHVSITQESSPDVQLAFNTSSKTKIPVTIKSSLDYDDMGPKRLKAPLFLNGAYSNILVIQVMNVNDNSPVFNTLTSQISLEQPENTLNISLLALEATDADKLGNVSYDLLTDDEGYFNLASSGEGRQLQLIKELDFEMKQLYRLTITAKDAPDERDQDFHHTTNLTVFINVKDIGDSPPRWLKPPVTITKKENEPKGDTLFSVSAIDGDTVVNNLIRYNLLQDSPQGWVDLNSTSGEVTLLKDLDREDSDFDDGAFITIKIQAQEIDGKTCTNISCIEATGLITVEDVDDNPPVFENATYTVIVPENKVNGLGLSIHVTDKDTMGQNGAFTLSLEGAPEGVFSVSSMHGIRSLVTDIQIKNSSYLDFEDTTHQNISFTIKAIGNNPQMLSSNASVTIHLTDVNDNAPKFDENTYTANITEDYAKGREVINVTATDGDINPRFGDESIRYSISGGQALANAIVIDNTTGQIKMNDEESPPFDFDQGIHSVIYTITAIDCGGTMEGKSNSVQLTINIEDIDDSPPQLTLPTDCSVEEEKNDAVVTTEITATDKDIKAELVYSIDWGKTIATKSGADVDKARYDFTKTFQIDPLTAELSTTETPPDREMMDFIRLMIVVNDTKTETGSSTDQKLLPVTIKDINDNSPTFTNLNETTQINVTENVPKQSVIFTVLASDVDEDNKISYFISGDQQFTSLLKIDEFSGQLQVMNTIDREMYPRVNITVTAKDSGMHPRNESVEISIEVLDQNDCLPVWVEEPSSIKDLNVTEGNSSEVFYTLKAFDNDQPGTSSSNITYFLGSEGKKYFTVDPVTGEVARGELDRESLEDSNYVLTVKVEAGDECDEEGKCAHKINGFMSVHVLDVNDCTPEFPHFQSPQMVAEVTEKSDAGYTLGRAPATDADEPNTPATNLTYKLVGVTNTTVMGCNSTDLFEVTTSSNVAIITSKKKLNGCWGTYNLTLSATDGELPFNEGRGVYQVTVNDVNDPPSIVSPPNGFKFNISEDRDGVPWSGERPVMMGETEMVIKARDPDKPATDNSKLRYSLLPSSKPAGADTKFRVDSENGTLYQLRPLDREDTAGFIYILDIQVKDDGDPPGNQTIHLNLTVLDEDEYLPTFENRIDNSTAFTENRTAGNETQDVASVATDKDETDNIFYFLVGGDKDSFELVDHNSLKPKIRTTKILDHETKTSYTLILQTTSNNSKPEDVTDFDESNPQQLLLYVDVIDINDMTPSFDGRHFWGGIAAGDNKERLIMTLQAYDPDLNDPTKYTITSQVKPSDKSIPENLTNPFKLKEQGGDLLLNFDVSEGMRGHFDFNVTATDQKDHKAETQARVFIVTKDDRVNLLFANPVGFIQAQQQKVEKILSSAFSLSGMTLIAAVEQIVEAEVSSASDVTAHFIDGKKVEPVSADTIINLQFTGDISQVLIDELGKIGLNLTKIGDMTVSPKVEEDTLFQMLLIVVASVLGGILALTLITACIQTTKLRRQVKALSINAFDSGESDLKNPGLAVPGSNVYANQGANPIFSLEERRGADAESVSSGDSVLIGVEHDPEFSGFAPSRSGPKSAAPSAPPADDGSTLGRPAVFDENSRHHMPQFDFDNESEQGGDAGQPESPFAAAGGVQNPLFDAEEDGLGENDGATQNPLFGGSEGTAQNPLFDGSDDGHYGTGASEF